MLRLNKNDYVNRLKIAKMKKKFNLIIKNWKYIAAAAGVICLAAGAVTIPGLFKNTEQVQGIAETTGAEMPKAMPEEVNNEEKEIQAAIDAYENIGIVRAEGYLNIRESPGTDADVIGKLADDAACEILDSDGEWYRISSGGIEGYIYSEYVLTGDEARESAKELVKLRAIINAEKLNVRKEPDKSSELVNQVLKDERYEIKGEEGEWVQILNGYASKEYIEIKYALNEARRLDLKSMVFNLYDNLGISNVNNYLNVRTEPDENAKIIAKMPSKSAGEILEEVNGWYKISSGGITGYVKSDYILTGAAARDEALKAAELMAIVSTDVLNVRVEPSTDSKIWTQVTNSERYAVLEQLDGWVKIELDSTSAYVSTDFTDVRYALGEAVKFTQLEEMEGQKSSLRNQIVNYALQFLGNPYVWGGTSLTRGADCSGFTMSVLGKYGIKLPHYSGSQANMGTAVKSSEMRPGDLLFYADSRGTINHVAMYIGNGQIVHAANKRSGIKISSWNYRNPIRIRNVIGN